MPTDKRQRKRAGHQARQAAAAAARRRQQARRTRAIAGGFLALVLVAGLAVVVRGGDDTKTVSSGSTTTTTLAPGASSTAVAKKAVDMPPPPPGATVKGDTKCPPKEGPQERTISFEKPPPVCVDVAKAYTAEMQTSKGLMIISLDVKGATKTVNNFVVLARYHFFDGIAFHRIVPGFVIQGGDPQQNGLGGPGYKFDDELPKPGAYKIGSLAMANSGPNTNGSQFFIISGDAGTSLQPQYSMFGQVTQGIDVVQAIDSVGIAGTQDGKPSEVVTIRSVTIKET